MSKLLFTETECLLCENYSLKADEKPVVIIFLAWQAMANRSLTHLEAFVCNPTQHQSSLPYSMKLKNILIQDL